jgi:hypothetical protein
MHAQATMEVSGPSLKDLYVEAISLDKFLLEADSLEMLHVPLSVFIFIFYLFFQLFLSF